MPLHTQLESLSKIPSTIQATKKDVNGTETSTVLEQMVLCFGEASSITHIGAMEPLTREANPIMNRPTMSCGTV